MRATILCLALTSTLAAQAPFGLLPRTPGRPHIGVNKGGVFMQAVDLDADSFPEIVNTALGYHWNRRQGLFGDERYWGVAAATASVAAFGDVNGDGHVDVLVSVYKGGLGEFPGFLYFGNGKGGFQDVSQTHLNVPPRDALCCAFADVDNDGDLDAVVGGYADLQYNPGSGRNRVLLNDGTGHFTENLAIASFPAHLETTHRMVPADFDGDGDVDVIAANTPWLGFPYSRLYLNDGTGKFTEHHKFDHPGIKVAVGDLDRDGDLDLSFGLYGSSTNAVPHVYLNDGNANFTEITASLPIGPVGSFHGLDFGDVDEDGDLDMIVPTMFLPAGTNEQVVLQQWINDGNANFTDVSSSTMPLMPWRFDTTEVTLADFDRDGDLDAIVNRAPTLSLYQKNRIFWNLTRHVYAPTEAKIGQPWTLELHAKQGHLVMPHAALGMALFDFGSLGVFGLDPATATSAGVFTMPASRQASLTLNVPNDPGLVGLKTFWQAIVIDPTNPVPRVTNVFEETIVQ